MDVDSIRLIVQAGNGGKGADSYYRRTDRKVVPHGGDGGSGGSIIFRADSKAPLLKTLKYRRKLVAEHGGHGGSSKKRGRTGENFVVLIPCGCKIYDHEKNLLIREFTYEGEEVIVAQGGKGGSGNQGGKPPSGGELGAVIDIEVTQRIHAEVFLVGLPNSGKSKFLNRLTRARMASESHPFSTTTPNAGVLKFSDYDQMLICELPSIYAHSHEGRGLGSDFLKHLEIAKFIAYFLEIDSNFAVSLKEGYQILRDQLEQYQPSYLQIPAVVIVNKMDLAESLPKLRRGFKPGVPVFYLSSLTGEGIPEFISFIEKEVYQKG